MAIQEWQKSLLRNWLTMHGVKEADADRFVSDPAVQNYARKAVAGEVPAPTDKQIAEYYSKGAKTGADPLTLFTADIAPKPPAAAAPQAPAEVPQPVAPTPRMAGGAPSPLGPLPPGTSIMEPSPGPLPSGIDIMAPSPGTLQSTPPPGFNGLDQPQIDLTPDAGMAGFAPVTPPGGGGMTMPGSYVGFDKTAPWLTAQLMQDFDLTHDQAAGIVGNLAHESGGFTTYHEGDKPFGTLPEGYQPGRTGGVGWPQYTGVRRKEYESWSAAHGLDPASTEANYGFLKEQLQGPYAKTIAAVKQTDTPQAAAAAFEGESNPKAGFENAGVPHMDRRYAYANQAAGVDVSGGADPFANVELQDAGVTPASWLSGGEYRPLGDGTQAPETLPIAPPPPSPSASDPFAGNVEPPPFTQGPTAAPPPSPVLSAPVLGGGVGYDTRPPSADPSMMQRPLEPQLGQFGQMDLTPLPSMMQRPLEPPLGPLVPPVGGAPVLGGMGGDLASGDGSLGPLIDPNMPLPTRAPTPPIVSMPMPSPSMMQAPLEPQLPTSPMQIPTRSTYSSNMSPIDQPPMSSFDPAAAPPLGAPSYDMANTFDPSMSQYDMANQFSPTQPPPATPQYDMANQFSPATPQYDMANTFTPTPSGGPPGTVPSSTEPSTFVPSGFGVASSSGFTPPPMGASGWPSPPPGVSTPDTTTPTARGFDPTQGAPGVGGVPAMPSWAIPGAFGMPGAGQGNIGGLSPMQYAGGTSVPTSMASSTGQYTGLGTNPATLGIPGMTSPMLGMLGPGPQPGMTDWSKSGRLTGGIGGGPISEGASPAPAGNAASSAAMESHARALMLSQHAADVANAYQNLAPRMVGAPVRSTISGSSMLGLTGRPSIMQSDLIRPYGMNVGFNPSFGSRF